MSTFMYGERFKCPARYTKACTPDARVRFVKGNTSVCDTCGSTWHYSCIHCGSSRGSYVEGKPGGTSHFALAGGGWVCHDCGVREGLGADVSRGRSGRPQQEPQQAYPQHPQQPHPQVQYVPYVEPKKRSGWRTFGCILLVLLGLAAAVIVVLALLGPTIFG